MILNLPILLEVVGDVKTIEHSATMYVLDANGNLPANGPTTEVDSDKTVRLVTLGQPTPPSFSPRRRRRGRRRPSGPPATRSGRRPPPPYTPRLHYLLLTY